MRADNRNKHLKFDESDTFLDDAIEYCDRIAFDTGKPCAVFIDSDSAYHMVPAGNTFSRNWEVVYQSVDKGGNG